MKTYNKLLVVAWMAIRPFSTNIHADTINWEEVSYFFNFDTVAEEKRTSLATNIRLLVEEQLKLPSGQNLWKAFQFWEQQHPELGFQFEFTLTSNTSAGITLKNLKYLKCLTQNKEIFCFEVTINEVFAENLEADQIFSENMLYRPCLIKLVDPDDPEKWYYHLREQKLPFFITLAHEFLHALNQLEKIDWILGTLGIRTMEELFKELNLNKFDINNLYFRVLYLFNKKENLEDFYKQLKLRYENYLSGKFPFARMLETIFPIQNFLRRKLRLQNDIEILQQKYKELWSNDNCDDSLDEMTVILRSERKIGFMETAYIGETSFLQEYYNNPFIISWSHYSAHSVKFLEKMVILLEKNYINNMIYCGKFKIHQQAIQKLLKKKNLDQIFCKNFFKYTNISDMDIFRKNVESTIKHLMKQSVLSTVIVNGVRKGKIEKIEKFEILQSDEGITLLPKYSKHIVFNNYKSVDLSMEENNSLMQKFTSISLNEKFFRYLQTINSKRKILVIMDDERLSYKYWLSDKDPHKIFSEARNIEKVLEQNSNADVKLYYNGFCFQKIIDQD